LSHSEIPSKNPSHRGCSPGTASPCLLPLQKWRAVELRAWTAHQRGDLHKALHILLQAYGSSLRQYCRRLVNDEALADDVYQTSLLQAFLHLPRFSGHSSFRVWLHVIARHRCLDALKVSRNQRKHLRQAEQLPEVPAPQDTPEEALLRKCTHTALRAELRRLPTQAHQALMLRYYEQLSYEEMGRRCAEQPATLRVRVSRTLSRLRRGLEGLDPSSP
jgi:RNA polymerase sigma-70 factor, ECF subfamily